MTRAAREGLILIIDYDFTFEMESSLDEVASGKMALDMPKGFTLEIEWLENFIQS